MRIFLLRIVLLESDYCAKEAKANNSHQNVPQIRFNIQRVYTKNWECVNLIFLCCFKKINIEIFFMNFIFFFFFLKSYRLFLYVFEILCCSGAASWAFSAFVSKGNKEIEQFFFYWFFYPLKSHRKVLKHSSVTNVASKQTQKGVNFIHEFDWMLTVIWFFYIFLYFFNPKKTERIWNNIVF